VSRDDSSSTPTVVAEGTCLYAGTVECDIRIVREPVRYGSGDHEDPPEIANDAPMVTYSIQYGSTTRRGEFTSSSRGFASLAEAKAEAERTPGIGPTVRWNTR
jgi:hypothetical protein